MMSPRNRQVPFLETSLEMFQQWRGNGSSSTACPTPTGSPTPAILQPKKDSSLPTEIPSKRRWGDYSKAEYEAGKAEFDKFKSETWEWKELPEVSQIFWMEEAIKVAREEAESGNNGEINYDQLQFWQDRREVPQK
jgi:hypothetical protein